MLILRIHDHDPHRRHSLSLLNVVNQWCSKFKRLTCESDIQEPPWGNKELQWVAELVLRNRSWCGKRWERPLMRKWRRIQMFVSWVSYYARGGQKHDSDWLQLASLKKHAIGPPADLRLSLVMLANLFWTAMLKMRALWLEHQNCARYNC